jgi:nucleotide-binding universal stress UspA family protein
VVHIDAAEATKARVEFAVDLAKAHHAHLVGVAFAPTALLPLYGGPDVGFAAMGEVLESLKEQGESSLAAFRARAEAEGVSVEGRLAQGVSDEFPREFAVCARHVDIAVLGQPRDGDPLIGQYALVERCLFASGRPVIIVPSVPRKSEAAGTIAAAWDGSAEAARAFNDALMFLKLAQRVVLLIASGSDAPEEGDAADIVMHLKRHGVTAEIERLTARDGDIGRLLLSKSAELGADMIVMGAFHHSRWREFILGGVTLTMLEDATIPLFMAH